MSKRIRKMSNGTLKKAAVVILSIVFLGVAIGTVYWFFNEKKVSEQRYLEKIRELETSLEEAKLEKYPETADQEQAWDEEGLTGEESFREIECGNISVSANVSEGDYVDVRIRYPDGSDYIVTAHKQVLNINRESRKVLFRLSEEELLLLSSASVDLKVFKGSGLYVTKYAAGDTKDSIVTYLPASKITDLLEENPNINDLSIQNNKQRRYILEAQLSQFLYEDGYEVEKWDGYTGNENGFGMSGDLDDTHFDEDNDKTGLPEQYGGSIWD